MSSLLMEALISSSTHSPAQPAMASPVLSPSPVLTAGISSPPPEPPPPVPAVVTIDENEDDDYDYEKDPMHQIMEMLNFTVVARKPTNVFETPLPVGEMMPKSQHIAEKKALYEMVQTHRKNLLKAQVDLSIEVAKGQELENKMQKVANIIAEVHNVYAKFVQNLVALMKKCMLKSKVSGQSMGLLTIGPFPNAEEVDKLLNLLNGLSSQFQNDFENLSNTKKALTEVADYLGDKIKSNSLHSVTTPTTASITPVSVAATGSAVVVEETGFRNVQRSVSTGEMSSSSDAPTIVIPDDEFSLGSFGDCLSSPSSACVNIASDVTNQVPITPTAEAGSSVAGPSSVLTSSSSSNEENSSVFMPVPNPSQSNMVDGRTLYTLVEYPERLNLVNAKHGFDLAKGRASGGTAWFCLCGQSFSSASLIKYHVRYFSAKWKFMCTLCSRKYPGVNFLKLHMLRTHKIMYVGSNGCRYCPKSFETTKELLRHLKTAHNKKLPADVEYLANETQGNPSATGPAATNTSLTSANTTTPTTSNTSEPKSQSVLVVNGTRCACGVDLGTKDALISHIRSEVEINGQHFKCTVCEEVFDHPCNFKSHFREKHGVEYQDYQGRRYGCGSCDEMFENYEDLETHTVSAHRMEQDLVDPLYDPLSDFNISMEGAGTTANTITFHVDPSTIATPLFTLAEPPVITLD